MLWLSLFFSRLPLEVFTRGDPDAGVVPLAVYEQTAHRQWVHACNCAAHARGIRPGMALGAARSLSTTLRCQRRDPAAEAEALTAAAVWAGQFTPMLSLQPPSGLLLEIEPSLRLFGGLAALHQRIAEGMAALGHEIRLGTAPTPLGAWLLARAGRATPALDRTALNTMLRPLPLRGLDLPEPTQAALHGLGLRRFDDLLRLPRAGLGKRLGAELVDYVDRALGRVPDPRSRFEPPARFRTRLTLPAEVADSEALLFPIRRLLLELEGFLLGSGSGVESFTLELWHPAARATRLEIGLLTPGRESAHLLTLTREHLQRGTLPAPVEAVVLSAERLVAMEAAHRDLFGPVRGEASQDWQVLVERLRARLGPEAVSGILPVDEHRPEHAWRSVPPGTGAQTGRPGAACRPLWLLDPPTALECVDGRPWYHGPLQLREGPERIESGWWDGVDIGRDYFVAETPQHARLWVYRELNRPVRWFLHGVFG